MAKIADAPISAHGHCGQCRSPLRPAFEHDEFMEITTGMPANDARVHLTALADRMPLEGKSVTTRTGHLGLEDALGRGVTGGPMARGHRTGSLPMREADARTGRMSLRGRGTNPGAARPQRPPKALHPRQHDFDSTLQGPHPFLRESPAVGQSLPRRTRRASRCEPRSTRTDSALSESSGQAPAL